MNGSSFLSSIFFFFLHCACFIVSGDTVSVRLLNVLLLGFFSAVAQRRLQSRIVARLIRFYCCTLLLSSASSSFLFLGRMSSLLRFHPVVAFPTVKTNFFSFSSFAFSFPTVALVDLA